MRLRVHDPQMQHARVYLNGVLQRYVIEADDVQGYVERYKLDAEGQLVYYAQRLQAERRYGKVVIEVDNA